MRGKVRSYPVCTMPSHKQIGIEKERVDLLPKGTDEINGQPFFAWNIAVAGVFCSQPTVPWGLSVGGREKRVVLI